MMSQADDSAVTGQAGEDSPAVIENKFKTAAKTLKDINFIDKAIKVYIMEYLSRYDSDDKQQWADRFNNILDTYRDAPGFEFLTEEVDGQKVNREVDPEKYDAFKTAKRLQYRGDANDLRSLCLRYFEREKPRDGGNLVSAIIENPNQVFLDSIFDNIRAQDQITDVTVNGFGGGVESVLEFPEPTTLNLSGPRFFAFALMAGQTGLYTKDYENNSPGDIPEDVGKQYGAREGAGADITFSGANEDAIRLIPNKDDRGVFERLLAGQLQLNPYRDRNLDLIQIFMPIYKYVQSDAGVVRKPLVQSDTGLFASAKNEFPGRVGEQIRTKKEILEDFDLDGDEGDEVNSDGLYYPIGRSGTLNGSKAKMSAYYEPIYNRCLNIVASIATLYEPRTVELFEEVLKDLLTKNPATGGVFTAPPKKPRKVVAPAATAMKAADHQCYLLENVRAISGAKEKLIKNAKQTYTNLGAINTTYSPGNIISVINHGGTDTTEEKDALINLCPEIYALLTPFIEVYRVEYKRDDEKKLRPVRHARIPFPNFIHPDDIDAITSGDYGRFAGAGIKSFTWSLDGVQPAEVDNNISAKLELHFQTIQDLFSLNEAQGAGAAQPGYLDLIIASPGVKESNNNNDETEEAPEAEKRLPPISTACFEAQMLSYDPRDFEIKVCAGWSLPPNFANIVNELEFARNHPPDYGEKLALAIQKSTTTLYLTLTDHELNFNENGSVDLNVFYQARLSGLTRSPAADIFASPSLFEDDIKDADKKIKELNKKKEKYLSDTNTTDVNDEALDGINKQLEEALDKKARIVKQDKAVKYRKFLDRLYCSNKIYSYTAEQRKLLRDIDSPRLRAAKAKGMTKTEEYTNGYNPQQTDGAADELYRNAAKTIGEIAGARGDSEAATAASRARGRRAIGKVKALEKARKAANGDLEIPFFYLGDLIDEVVGHVGNLVNKSKGSLQILLSEVELLDPLQMYQIAQVKIPCPNDKSKEIVRAITDIDPMRYKDLSGISFTINIGSIPISLEFFQEWFINNVVKGQASKYNLLRFIKTVCSSLIAKAFNSICFEGGPQFSLRFDTATFNFDRSFAGEIVNVDTLAKSKTNAQKNDCGELIANKPQTVPAFVVSSMDSKPLTGDYVHDLRRGIYHYYLGASCGIAKSIKFNRTGIPYYREARLQRTSALSALQLREMYNVNIEMVGNTIHRNGQYIYVNPVAIGAGSLKTKGTLPNLARLLGIGGYYMVTAVSHTVSSAGFNVSLTGIQEGIDFSEAGTPIQLVPYDPPDGIVTIGEMTAEPLPGQSIPAGPD